MNDDMTTNYDVLIIGAGMVGSAVACGLAKAGLSVGILDTQPPPEYQENSAPHIRVSAISFASEQLLRNIGAWDHIAETRMCPYRRLAVNELPARKGLSAKLPDISSWARTEFCAEEIGKTHLGHIIENDLIQLGLHKAMACFENIALHCPAKVVEWNLQAEHKSVFLETGEQLTARLIVGADGAQSKVRVESGIGQYRDQYEQQAFVATVSYRGEQQDITWQAFTSHGPIAFLPLSDSGEVHYASLVWYDHPEQIAQLKQMSEQELLRFFQREYPDALPSLDSLIESGSFPLYKSHAKRYIEPGVVLAGDAAHTINPLAGQGVNLGFMDAAVLIETLAQAELNGKEIGALEVLKEYERKRRFENQTMMNLMDMFYYGFSNDLLPLRIVRNLGLGVANHLGVAKNKVMQFAIGATGKLPKLARPA